MVPVWSFPLQISHCTSVNGTLLAITINDSDSCYTLVIAAFLFASCFSSLPASIYRSNISHCLNVVYCLTVIPSTPLMPVPSWPQTAARLRLDDRFTIYLPLVLTSMVCSHTPPAKQLMESITRCSQRTMQNQNLNTKFLHLMMTSTDSMNYWTSQHQ